MKENTSAFSKPVFSRRSVIGGGAAAIAVTSLPGIAHAQVRIDITKGQVQPMPIAVSPFYGAQPKTEDAVKIKAPINAQYGEMDERITSGWPAFDAALSEAKVPHEGHVYKGAQHGFHNDTTPRYDEKSATLAWQRTLEFFNRYLR